MSGACGWNYAIFRVNISYIYSVTCTNTVCFRKLVEILTSKRKKKERLNDQNNEIPNPLGGKGGGGT